MNAWRAVPIAAAAALQTAKTNSDIAITAAETATKAAAGSPGAPAALAAENLAKANAITALGNSFAATGADIHTCTTPSPAPPHGPGVVLQASTTVVINNLPACRMGDKVIEPLGPPNPIAMGCPTVYIG